MTVRIAALCGSLRQDSLNRALIEAVRAMTLGLAHIDILSTSALPHFNADEDEAAPQTVELFRLRLRSADAVLICTPEYAMGIPGTLKNAIDWTVGSSDFSGKPTALITCSSSGEIAHQALQAVLQVIEARLTPDTALLIRHNRTKINLDGSFKDSQTAHEVERVMMSLLKQVANAPSFAG